MNGDIDYSQTTQTLKVTGGLDAKVSTALTDAAGTFTITVDGVTVNQTVKEWQSGEQAVAGATIDADADMVGKTKVNYVFTVTAASATAASSTYLSDITFA